MHEYIEVKFISHSKGRGAFAKKAIKKGAIIDIAPIVLIPNSDYEDICKTMLYDYCYIWEDPDHEPGFDNAITLSLSQFINHSYTPNIKYIYDYDKQAIEYHAIKNIKAGEELTVNYNGIVNDKSPLWFEVEE